MSRRRMTSTGVEWRPTIAFGEVPSHLLVELVILQQLVELFEHRVDSLGHLRHQCKHIFCLIAIDKHLTFLLHALLARFLLFHTLLALKWLHRLISHHKRVLGVCAWGNAPSVAVVTTHPVPANPLS